MAPDDGSPLPFRPFTGWRKQSDPDPEAVAELYRSGVTQKEIARRLGVSLQRVAEALAAAGVDRRESGRACPVGAVELRRLMQVKRKRTKAP